MTALEPKKASNRKPPNGGNGRPKGALNKTTIAAKQAHVLAFEGAGGVKAFTEWAIANRTEFYKLYSRLLPLEANLHHDGTVTLESLITASLVEPT
jgi:hypothetical protein